MLPSTPYPIPETFMRFMTEIHGQAGQAWLDGFPEFLAGLEQRWAMRLLPPFDLSYNYVAPAIRANGDEVVLKVGMINPELLSEIASLRAYAGRGIVRLIDAIPDQGAMLLERLRPGQTLAGLDDDDAATRTAAEVMRDLWIPAPADPEQVLCRADRWAAGLARLRETFAGETGPFPARLVDLAEGLFAELLGSAGPLMLLHGDLHHWNILSAERRPWLALDPKGLVGEAEYEVGAFMRNQFPTHAGPAAIQKQAARRLAIFHEVLGFDTGRMLAWTVAQGLLSAWWSYEDERAIAGDMLNFTAALAEMLP